MKTTFVAAFALSVSTLTQASESPIKTTIEFELAAPIHDKALDVNAINQKLKAQGLDGLPTKIVLDLKGQRAYWKLLTKRIDAAKEAKILGQYDDLVIENGYFHQYPEICYRGDINQVAPILNAMRTIPDEDLKSSYRYRAFVNPDAGILGIAWGDQRAQVASHLENDQTLEEYYGEAGEIPDGVKNLKKWNKKTQVLLVSDLGPQGDSTEAYETVIKACKQIAD